MVLIQESKNENFELCFIKSLWSSKDIGWDFVELFGTTGGMLTMWDTNKLSPSVTETLKGGYSLSVKCITLWRKTCCLTNVYGPTDYKDRKFVWPGLLILSDYCMEAWCFGGEFNITRWVHERFPLGRITRGMRLFNNFLEKA